jgi:hypothetical protein
MPRVRTRRPGALRQRRARLRLRASSARRTHGRPHRPCAAIRRHASAPIEGRAGTASTRHRGPPEGAGRVTHVPFALSNAPLPSTTRSRCRCAPARNFPRQVIVPSGGTRSPRGRRPWASRTRAASEFDRRPRPSACASTSRPLGARRTRRELALRRAGRCRVGVEAPDRCLRADVEEDLEAARGCAGSGRRRERERQHEKGGEASGRKGHGCIETAAANGASDPAAGPRLRTWCRRSARTGSP